MTLVRVGPYVGEIFIFYSWKNTLCVEEKLCVLLVFSDLTRFVCLILQVDLGIAVQKACESQNEPMRFLYPLVFSIKEKIEAIAKSYGASGVEYSEQVTPT